jgi:glucokinase
MNGMVVCADTFRLKARQEREYLLGELAKSIDHIRKKAASEGVNPIAVGIAARGFIDHEKGIVLGPGHGIKNWKNVQLSRILNRETGLPVYVGNDANLMTIAEQKFGAANGYSNVVLLHCGPELEAES